MRKMAPIHNLIRMANGLDVEPTGESLIKNNIITNGTLYSRLQESTTSEIEVKSSDTSTRSRIITNGILKSKVQDSHTAGSKGRDTNIDGDNSLTERRQIQQNSITEAGCVQHLKSKNPSVDFSAYLIQGRNSSEEIISEQFLNQGKAVDPNQEAAVLDFTKYLIKKNENFYPETDDPNTKTGESIEIVKDLIAKILENMIFSDNTSKTAENMNLEARNKGTKLTRFQRFRQAVKNFKTAILRPFTSCVKIQDTE